MSSGVYTTDDVTRVRDEKRPRGMVFLVGVAALAGAFVALTALSFWGALASRLARRIRPAAYDLQDAAEAVR